jgi:hypothetical protein
MTLAEVLPAGSIQDRIGDAADGATRFPREFGQNATLQLRISRPPGIPRCGNQKLIEAYLSLVKQVRWATTLSLHLPSRLREAFREHQEIFEAFRRKDGETARALIADHSHASMQRVLSQMESMEKRREEGEAKPRKRRGRNRKKPLLMSP